MRDARVDLGAQQPRRPFDEHVAPALGGIDDDVHAGQRPSQPAAVLQVHRIFGRVP
jgi:hypothetical protein